MKYLIALTFLLLAGCSHMIIVKECKAVEGGEVSVCKTMKPWE